MSNPPSSSSSSSSPSLMDTLFQRTLEDLIKSIRLQYSVSTDSLISRSVSEIHRELNSTDPHTKSTAIQKLAYLSSIHGVDISSSAFPIVETMSFHNFSHKKIGYHAASLSFNESTPVILLITNQLRKDLSSFNEFEVGLALELLGQVGNLDLCRDLTPEVFTLLSSGKGTVRKKAVGVLLRVFGKYPDAVRVCFKRLVENLEGGDAGVLPAAVGVFCELVVKDARAYLPLAPEFYRVLVESRNNWVLIKVLKIFSRLVPVEPRLAKKVVEPVCELMGRTTAVSVLFECIRTVVSCLDEFESAVKLAVEKNRELLMSDDPNLKSLGLQALSIVAGKQSWAVLESKEVVVKSLSSLDPNIRVGALRLLMAIVSESNLGEICRVLVNYALKSDPEFCNEILGSILLTCSRNVYEIVVDFDWYVSLLRDMTRIPHCRKGQEIESHLVDIGMRVMDARPQLVHVSRDLLIDPALLGNPYIHSVLSAAAWLSGEFPEFSKDPYELIESLIQPRTSLLPPSIKAIYIQSCFKVLTFCVNWYFLSKGSTASSMGPCHMESEVSSSLSDRGITEGSSVMVGNPASSQHDGGFDSIILDQTYGGFCSEKERNAAATVGQTSSSASIGNFGLTKDSISRMMSVVELALGPLSGSNDVEVCERAKNVLGLIDLVKLDIVDVSDLKEAETQESEAFKITKFICDAFLEELGPVSVSAQEKVPIPDGLNPIDNLQELDLIYDDVQLPTLNSLSLSVPQYAESSVCSLPDLQSKEDAEPLSGSTSLLAEHRKRHGLYYLLSEKTENESNDYPPANDLTLPDKLSDDSEDLLKLTAQSLVPKKKSSQGRLRPVVVKLDEGDDRYVSTKKTEQKDDDSLSGAVRDVLLGKEMVTSSIQSHKLDNLPVKKKGKEKLDVHTKSEENLGGEERSMKKKSSAGRRKHRAHSKEKRHKKPVKSGEEDKEIGSKEKQKTRHHRRSQRSQSKEDGSSTAAHTSVIPDFLL